MDADTKELKRIADEHERLVTIVGKLANKLTHLILEREMADNGGKNSMEYFRLITPFMLAVITFIGWTMSTRLGQIDNHLISIDEKMFKHLTNDDLHTPRQSVVSKDEFTLYQTMRDRQMMDIKDGICRLEIAIDKKK